MLYIVMQDHYTSGGGAVKDVIFTARPDIGCGPDIPVAVGSSVPGPGILVRDGSL